jgi:hypothetical protein
MSRQPFPEEIARAEDMLRLLGPTVTIDLRSSDRFLSGELWTIHKNVGDTLGMGQAGTLEAAMQDLRAVSPAVMVG